MKLYLGSQKHEVMPSLGTVNDLVDRILFFPAQVLSPGTVHIPIQLFRNGGVSMFPMAGQFKCRVVAGRESDFDLFSSRLSSVTSMEKRGGCDSRLYHGRSNCTLSSTFFLYHAR